MIKYIDRDENTIIIQPSALNVSIFAVFIIGKIYIVTLHYGIHL